jgi:hypothetical protein
MPKYWLISDRNNNGTGTGLNNNGLSYFVSDAGPLNNIANWRRVAPGSFKTLLAAAADQFPDLDPGQNESQSHVTILIHGFNVSFNSSTSFYQDLCGRLFDGPQSMGLCILYDWPSQGTVAGYLPDRAMARRCAEDLTDILSTLFDWLIKKQKDAVTAAAAAVAGKKTAVTPCKAKVSVIAPPATDNVWDVDCSSFFPSSDSGIDIHGAYFVTDTTITLIRKILSGMDRNVLVSTGATTGNAWPPK